MYNYIITECELCIIWNKQGMKLWLDIGRFPSKYPDHWHNK